MSQTPRIMDVDEIAPTGHGARVQVYLSSSRGGLKGRQHIRDALPVLSTFMKDRQRTDIEILPGEVRTFVQGQPIGTWTPRDILDVYARRQIMKGPPVDLVLNVGTWTSAAGNNPLDFALGRAENARNEAMRPLRELADGARDALEVAGNAALDRVGSGIRDGIIGVAVVAVLALVGLFVYLKFLT